MAIQSSAQSGFGSRAQPGSTTASHRMGDKGHDGGVMAQAKGKVQELASQAREKAGHRVESGLDRGKSRAADTLSSVAQSLLASRQQLRERQQDGVGRYVEKAAERLDRFSTYLKETDVSEIVDTIEDFARREPPLFLGATFAVGLLGARFVKSSRRQQESLERQAGGAAYPGYAGTGAPTGSEYLRDRAPIGTQAVHRPPERGWRESGSGVTGAGTPGQSHLGSSAASMGYRPSGSPDGPPR